MDVPFILALKSVNGLVPPGGLWPESNAAQTRHEVTLMILFSASLILLIWLISRIQRRMNVPQVPYRPWRVFWRLLKHHGLGLSDRLMLCAIASSRRIKQPTLLLLSPGLFTRHAMEWLGDSHLVPLWPGAKTRLTRIAQQVFTEPPAPAKEPLAAIASGE